uniref:Uncharacterized protein n=1 Tax=Caenorhabditis japonica TaxID=281687 RepID=A0A8R1EJ32_CAEJA
MTWMTWMIRKAAIKARGTSSLHTHNRLHIYRLPRSSDHGQDDSLHRSFHGPSPFGRRAPSIAGSTNGGERRTTETEPLPEKHRN